MFYSFCWWLCMIWIRVMYHVEIVGRENVPRDRGLYPGRKSPYKSGSDLCGRRRARTDPLYGEGGAVREGEAVFMAAP